MGNTQASPAITEGLAEALTINLNKLSLAG